MLNAICNCVQRKFLLTATVQNNEDPQENARPAICSLCKNFTGPSCIGNRCHCSCHICHNFACSMIDKSKCVLGCLVNAICYPFIPCTYALLPQACQSSDNSYPHYCCEGTSLSYWSKYTKAGCYCCFTQPCCLIWLSIVITVFCLLMWNFTQDSEVLIQVLLFLNELDQVTLSFCFLMLFTMVSFPVMWGYLVLNLAAGYLYGFLPAIPVVIVSVTFGMAISHIICKRFLSEWLIRVLRTRANFSQIEAIIKVIDGNSGLKVIALTRLTPIPFGFQNGLFAVSKVNMFSYLFASVIGLLPTLVLNCYIGSTLRTMQEILDQDNPGGFLIFIGQIAIGICLMLFVVRHARKELAEAINDPQKTEPSENAQAPAIDPLCEVKVTQPLLSTDAGAVT